MPLPAETSSRASEPSFVRPDCDWRGCRMRQATAVWCCQLGNTWVGLPHPTLTPPVSSPSSSCVITRSSFVSLSSWKQLHTCLRRPLRGPCLLRYLDLPGRAHTLPTGLKESLPVLVPHCWGGEAPSVPEPPRSLSACAVATVRHSQVMGKKAPKT